jgi:lysophospholipase L1-like esterase
MFIDAAHFTPAGHRVMADLLADKLCIDSWLPQPCR